MVYGSLFSVDAGRTWGGRRVDVGRTRGGRGSAKNLARPDVKGSPVRTEPRQLQRHGEEANILCGGSEGSATRISVRPLQMVAGQVPRACGASQQTEAELDRDRSQGSCRKSCRCERPTGGSQQPSSDVVTGRPRYEAGGGRTPSKARRSKNLQPLTPADRWAARGGPADASGRDTGQSIGAGAPPTPGEKLTELSPPPPSSGAEVEAEA